VPGRFYLNGREKRWLGTGLKQRIDSDQA